MRVLFVQLLLFESDPNMRLRDSGWLLQIIVTILHVNHRWCLDGRIFLHILTNTLSLMQCRVSQTSTHLSESTSPKKTKNSRRQTQLGIVFLQNYRHVCLKQTSPLCSFLGVLHAGFMLDRMSFCWLEQILLSFKWWLCVRARATHTWAT